MIELTHENWERIKEVNSTVNEEIKYFPDEWNYNKPEFWELPVEGLGDCEDFALEKRKRLMDYFYWEDLCLTTCWDETGTYHSVLTVRTDHGDFVLDNRYDEVQNWEDMPYTWHKIMLGKEWYKINN